MIRSFKESHLAICLIVICSVFAGAAPKGRNADSLPVGAIARLGSNSFLRIPYNVISVAFSPNGKYLAAAASSKMVIVWETNTGREVVKLPSRHSRTCDLFFTHDGKKLVCAGGKIDTWSTDSWELNQESLAGREALIARLAELRGSRYVIHSDSKSIVVRNLMDNRDLLKVPLSNVGTPQVTPNHRLLLIPTRDSETRNYELHVWDISSGKKKFELTGFRYPVSQVLVSADSRNVLASSNRGPLRQWSLVDGKLLRTPNKTLFGDSSSKSSLHRAS